MTDTDTSPQTQTPGVPPTLPCGHEARYYDRRVWVLGEEGSQEGVLVEGCDRRSYAALNAHRRDQGYGLDRVVVEWVAGVETGCGCTAEQHAEHADCHSECGGNADLPPCGDRYDWVPCWAETPGAPALPVLVGDW